MNAWNKITAIANGLKASGRDRTPNLEEWYRINDRGTAEEWYKSGAEAFGRLTNGVDLAQPPETGFKGLVWFHRQFDWPAAWAGKDLMLNLGYIQDVDRTWVNGVKVGECIGSNIQRVYEVPSGVAKPGNNEITIRVLNIAGGRSLASQAGAMWIAPAGEKKNSPLTLSGNWQQRRSKREIELPTPPYAMMSTMLYNGMLAPLVPCAIKGVVWYQGEANIGRAVEYRESLPAMIADWRRRFGVGDFPFYIVQLAGFTQPSPEPPKSDWAELREAQALTARSIANSGLAVAIDIGDANDVHPKNKLEVGRRLALCALASTYGKKIEWSGPWYKKMELIDKGVRLHFDHVQSGLLIKGDKLVGFAIAGEDRKFVWADAVVDGDTVVVSSPKVSKPVAVHYAWDTNPVCNLYNRAGLPAVPFRTEQ